VKQSPRASPDLCTPLAASIVIIPVEQKMLTHQRRHLLVLFRAWVLWWKCLSKSYNSFSNNADDGSICCMLWAIFQ